MAVREWNAVQCLIEKCNDIRHGLDSICLSSTKVNMPIVNNLDSMFTTSGPIELSGKWVEVLLFNKIRKVSCQTASFCYCKNT